MTAETDILRAIGGLEKQNEMIIQKLDKVELNYDAIRAELARVRNEMALHIAGPHATYDHLVLLNRELRRDNAIADDRIGHGFIQRVTLLSIAGTFVAVTVFGPLVQDLLRQWGL